jgi:membrane protein DedA with SNARE-associated domain
MVGTVPRTSDLHTPEVLRSRGFILSLAVVRAVLEVAAIPLAPALYRDHVAVLTLLRPTKEVFLFGGFQVREGNAWLPVLVLAAIPLLLGGVWIFYLLGRAYRDDLEEADLPGIAGRVLPKKRIDHLRALLDERGPRIVFFGRLAAFPSTLMAAAAGACGVSFREFVVADAAGAILSMLALFGIGYGLGEAYDEAGPWVTGAGALVLAVLLVVLGRALLRSGSGGTATRKA